jgi:hypothetical protein
MDGDDEADPPISHVTSHVTDTWAFTPRRKFSIVTTHKNAALARQQRKRALDQWRLLTRGTNG